MNPLTKLNTQKASIAALKQALGKLGKERVNEIMKEALALNFTGPSLSEYFDKMEACYPNLGRGSEVFVEPTNSSEDIYSLGDEAIVSFPVQQYIVCMHEVTSVLDNYIGLNEPGGESFSYYSQISLGTAFSPKEPPLPPDKCGCQLRFEKLSLATASRSGFFLYLSKQYS
ncbi:MAG: hypothetical protein U0T84_09230 [Chitinophagales bacterium]